MMHAGRPDLLATGLVSILADSGSIVGATAVSRANDGTVEILAACGEPRPSAGADLSPERSISVGSAVNRTVEVRLRPRADIESAATLNAVTILVGVVRDLERAHAEREERETLWPVEEIPTEGEQAVVTGRMRELMSFVRRVAGTTVGVLITGESGTGKEILARAIHRYSARAERPFVPFNCTAIPREMLESQLFGHRRGAFTGADRDNAGLIRSAKDGTLFLDEIGELGLDLQPKLLRFLESGEICPLGEPNPFIVDVRIIAATNSNLEQLVQDGRFREDLFYRLNVIRLAIPPLRERRDEVPPLVHHFVARAAAEFSKGRIRVTEETMEHLLLYPWPGNIRQLNNELRRMVALAEVDAVLTPSSLSLQVLRATPKAAPRSTAGQDIAVPLHDKLMPTLSRVEREMIRVALGANHGRLEAAAKALGISRKGLYLKRQRLGL
jgi:DNA-binding NtrC family response regulator